MNLIQFGDTYINFDLVTSVRNLSSPETETEATPGLIRVEFGNGRRLDFTGSLQTFREWLLANSTSATTIEATP